MREDHRCVHLLSHRRAPLPVLARSFRGSRFHSLPTPSSSRCHHLLSACFGVSFHPKGHLAHHQAPALWCRFLGYRKADDDSKQWVIDEPAAKVVRYIFQLCIEGLGVTKIARRLEAEKILTPTAYYNSIGRKTRNKVIDPYHWSENSVDHILCNMQYTGCTVNFKSSTVSFKVHKTVYNSPEDWVIIPNTQEAIIDMDTWERVQEIKKHRRRNTATGRQSIFSGLMYCGDCGSKLYFCAAKSVKEHQEFYRCSAYKENRGSCTIHFIRNVVLERMVLKLIREAAEYITEYEPVFL